MFDLILLFSDSVIEFVSPLLTHGVTLPFICLNIIADMFRYKKFLKGIVSKRDILNLFIFMMKKRFLENVSISIFEKIVITPIVTSLVTTSDMLVPLQYLIFLILKSAASEYLNECVPD